ncbi:MAG: hypothetical protein J7L96_06000, partial [Bacteroidales bacterium]|nr:hypothetical protein [Bacteroidales bacterium]
YCISSRSLYKLLLEIQWIILFLSLIIKLLNQHRRILYEKEAFKPMDYVSRSKQTTSRWLKAFADSKRTCNGQKNRKEIPFDE